jgi:hypothetical protein
VQNYASISCTPLITSLLTVSWADAMLLSLVCVGKVALVTGGNSGLGKPF